MSLADSMFIFGLALIIFGPKKLPEIGRQIGKIMLEFRRASNEFKMQIEEELRTVEQTDRQNRLAAADAAKALTPPPDAAVASSELTVRPPSSGITESTESPYKPVSVPDETTEPVAGEPDSARAQTYGSAGAEQADANAEQNPVPPPGSSTSSSGSLALQPSIANSIYGTRNIPEEIAEPATKPVMDSPDPGDLKIAETEPDVPEPIPYVADQHEGLQEQATNHHG